MLLSGKASLIKMYLLWDKNLISFCRKPVAHHHCPRYHNKFPLTRGVQVKTGQFGIRNESVGYILMTANLEFWLCGLKV